jgi:hypothetical protein
MTKFMLSQQPITVSEEHPDVKIKLLHATATIGKAKMELPQVEFRIYGQSLKSRVTIVLVDKRECITTKGPVANSTIVAAIAMVLKNVVLCLFDPCAAFLPHDRIKELASKA